MTKATLNRQTVDGAETGSQADLAASNRDGSNKIALSSEAGEQAQSEQARQRLTQELGNGSENAPQTLEQARALVADLGTRLTTDPQAGLSAHGEISPGLYTAATARPNT